MGKQIRFFMLGSDEIKFLELIEATGDLIVDDKGNTIDIIEFKEGLLHSEEKKDYLAFTEFYIIFPDSNIIKFESGIINQIRSDVIEVLMCSVTEENLVREGRLWAEFKYYDENRMLKSKGKWFEEKFNLYRNWIKKNLRISVNKGYYIGEEAYKLYKEKGYRMKAGPKVEIKF